MSVIFSGILLFMFLLFILNILTSVWAYRDSLARGNSKEYSIVVLIGTIMFPVVGLIVYFLIRDN